MLWVLLILAVAVVVILTIRNKKLDQAERANEAALRANWEQNKSQNEQLFSHQKWRFIGSDDRRVTMSEEAMMNKSFIFFHDQNAVFYALNESLITGQGMAGETGGTYCVQGNTIIIYYYRIGAIKTIQDFMGDFKKMGRMKKIVADFEIDDERLAIKFPYRSICYFEKA